MKTKEPLSGKYTGFPWGHVIGYMGSILLTLVALWLAVNPPFSQGGIITILLVLAVLQILIQLIFFMHITESRGPAFHTLAIVLGFLFTFAVVAGSIWIMTFNSQVQ
ncbi:cytochrome o ubiquinol oxidase subunit IV [Thermoflavimicrobium dichotomicum]|nr:cytochrome C oxidase subunit IV family protein [Thermoflavimicrobium dichotomicum]